MKQVTKKVLAEFSGSIANYSFSPDDPHEAALAALDGLDLLMVLKFLADGDTNAAFEKALSLNNGTAEAIPLSVWQFMEDSEVS